jgi:hypothetical protein
MAQRFPQGWNKERVARILAHYEAQREDEAALRAIGQTVMVVPSELVPAVRALIAKRGE